MTETDIREGLQEWSKDYDHHINNPPSEGAILSTMEQDTKVLLTVELVENHSPFIYGLAFVPEIVGSALGWYLRSTENSESYHGWKCILLPRARTELIRKFGLQNETMEVESLRVVRPSQSGKALLCEVHKYGDEVEAAETSSETAEKVDGSMSPETEKLVQEVAEEVAEANPADIDSVIPQVEVQEPEVQAPEESSQKPELTLGK